jgi:2-C-methyl-D-erythritol 4-phosphate cytidylyltransferase
MTIALILAAGRGERLKDGRPKALVELAGRPLVQWSVDALRDVDGMQRIVIALPPGTQAPLGLTGVDGGAIVPPPGASAPLGVTAVDGGAVRSDSVRRALAAAGPGDPVLVHDAARPLVTVELAASVIAALEGDEEADAAIAAVPVTDTVKRVRDDDRRAGGDGAGGERAEGGSSGVVSETLDRRDLWAVQTPQVFRRAALERALDVPEEVLAEATDDAWLIEQAGGKVLVVGASDENLKVTTPLDLAVAEMLLARRAQVHARPA